MSFEDDAVKRRIKQDCEFSFLFNTLFHEFYFTSVFKIQPKIGSFRLPTNSRDAHIKLFW